MDVKTRIDKLSEQEAKAALVFLVKKEGRFKHDMQWIVMKGEPTLDECENKVLNMALKEARK